MQFDWWTFAIQLVNIAVLGWLLARFLFRPVAHIIAERKAETARVLEKAEDARRAALEAEGAAEAERDRIVAERLELIEKARADADAQKAALIDKARNEAAAILEKAKSEAEHATEEERVRQLRRATDLAVAMAGRLLADLPVDARVAGYAERLAGAIDALDAGERTAILENDGGLHLVAPRMLSEEERAAVDAAIGQRVPHDGPLPVETDETLIAGLELRSRHGAIRNSLGADLERMAKALNDNEKG
ncbi:F0F1 ATP synthase subunit B [Oricola indica]|jgi:F-type H+-transporting ATPase subunit b|uniref:F0F1 ATP synthase subunit B family protein n=1 Tax=Oricola indica TaxID=2872591 RepID=UPI001CBF97D8|nr:F0F1 ATP synthase subunit B [Oricola indica]